MTFLILIKIHIQILAQKIKQTILLQSAVYGWIKLKL